MRNTEFLRTITVNDKDISLFDITLLEQKGVADIKRLPFSIRILVENLLRKLDGRIVSQQNLTGIARWQKSYGEPVEIPFHPARVLMQDFTGVPAVVDLAAMRDAVKDLGGDPARINPLVPVDLIVDHSIQVDAYGTADALTRNVAKEYGRNGERYALLKWAQRSFDNLRVVPPNSGICHQVNLEYLGQVIVSTPDGDGQLAYPDTLVGTDSHTTMINGIGVMGWGVGGIEAEAVMLGQPYYMSIPEVIGVKMSGRLREGVTATDMVLFVTELLRRHKVVEKFVEFFGPGMKSLTIPDRATIANMSPEYGATMGFFPVDEKTVDYLKATHRRQRADIVDACSKALGLFYSGEQDPDYTEVVEVDLDAIEPSVAGPSRPQDRIAVSRLKASFAEILGCNYKGDTDVRHISKFFDESGCMTTREEVCVPKDKIVYDVTLNGKDVKIGDGSIVIAAITSCTNTSNPFVLLGAALLAKKAVQHGLRVPSYVKTTLAPGSRVVMDYLKDSGLTPYLEALGFHLAAFGCTTCIGNSGPLHPGIERVIKKRGLTVAAVLSGNRNFEARIHQSIKANFLASPMLVVAYALAGRIDVDLATEALGIDPNGDPVHLKDIWPASSEIESLIGAHVRESSYAEQYGRIFEGDRFWKKLPAAESTTFAWDEKSTYIKKPPYFEGFALEPQAPSDVQEARVLMLLGDSVTTDHISPAGAIPESYPAGRYLTGEGVAVSDYNSYGSRRGNHHVMMRGTFGNIRIKNMLVDSDEGSFTLKLPAGERMFVYDAAMDYKSEGVPLVVIGGREYGTGSSRDWAAKGTNLLGVRAVIAVSYERIHRSNLVGMGVLPLMFKPGENAEKLGLDGTESFTISGVGDICPRKTLHVTAEKPDGGKVSFQVTARLDTDVDVDYFGHGGILPYVLRQIVND